MIAFKIFVCVIRTHWGIFSIFSRNIWDGSCWTLVDLTWNDPKTVRLVYHFKYYYRIIYISITYTQRLGFRDSFWVFFSYKKIARPNWDANSWEGGMTVDANSLRHLSRWLSKKILRPAVCEQRQTDRLFKKDVVVSIVWVKICFIFQPDLPHAADWSKENRRGTAGDI